MTSVIILGGGIAGLAAAHRLVERDIEVTILEAEDRLGGLGASFSWSGCEIERFYHCTMPSDHHLHDLVEAAGMGRPYAWNTTTMGMVVKGRHYDFNTPGDLLRFDPLTPMQRLRLGAIGKALPWLRFGRDLDLITAEAWLRPLVGKAAWDFVWLPMLASKFGPSAADIPAQYLYTRSGRESNVAVRGYPTGGYRRLADGLRDAIRNKGGQIHLRTPVHSLSSNASRVTASSATARFEADWAISTLPLTLLESVAGNGLGEHVASLPRLTFQGVVNALFFLKRPLTGHYWTPVLDSGVEFDGVVEMSALAGTVPYAGHHAAYTMRYAPRTDPLFTESLGAIARRWTDGLLRVYGDRLGRDDIAHVEVFRAPHVEPVWPLGFARAKPTPRLHNTRLWLATTAQVYPEVTSWNASTKLATRVADDLMATAA